MVWFMKQSTIFLRNEGNRYHLRNAHKPRLPDPVLDAIRAEHIRPQSVLENGCGDGWRLKIMHQEWGSTCFGLDPSKDAIATAPQSDKIKCWRGTADAISLNDNSVDMVIYAFCLYLVDREDLFRIVCEGDRVLQDGGYLVIHDFLSDRAYSRRYEHAEGVKTYKMDYSRLWLANPAYRCIRKNIFGESGLQPTDRDDQYTVTILRKDLTSAWPLHEPVNILAAG